MSKNNRKLENAKPIFCTPAEKSAPRKFILKSLLHLALFQKNTSLVSVFKHKAQQQQRKKHQPQQKQQQKQQNKQQHNTKTNTNQQQNLKQQQQCYNNKHQKKQ